MTTGTNALLSIRNTLCQVEVRGKDNMVKMLRCVQALEALAAEVEKQEKEETHGSNDLGAGQSDSL